MLSVFPILSSWTFVFLLYYLLRFSATFPFSRSSIFIIQLFFLLSNSFCLLLKHHFFMYFLPLSIFTFLFIFVYLSICRSNIFLFPISWFQLLTSYSPLSCLTFLYFFFFSIIYKPVIHISIASLFLDYSFIFIFSRFLSLFQIFLFNILQVVGEINQHSFLGTKIIHISTPFFYILHFCHQSNFIF